MSLAMFELRERRRRPRLLLAGFIVFALCLDTAMAANLLLNSSFELATNGATPDYWDLHHAAALQFRHLYQQYNLVDTPAAPVAGVRVLRIVNSVPDFPHVYLLSKIRESKWPAGDYLFSVYIKADRPGMRIRLAAGWDRVDRGVDSGVTTEWRRYSAHFRIDDPDKAAISPLIVLPSRGTYWIAAPQFESGDHLTPYALAAEDGNLSAESVVQSRSRAAAMTALEDAANGPPPAGISAQFEFSSYDDEAQARLKIGSTLDSEWKGAVNCTPPVPPAKQAPIFSANMQIARAQSQIIDVPLTGLSSGEYVCSVSGSGQSATAVLRILAPRPMRVRLNQFRHTVEINKSGFQVRGVMIGSVVPPGWYLADVAAHGINTLFFFPGADGHGSLDFASLDQVIALASKYDLKLIVGPPVMGQKDSTWQPRLDRYSDLIRRYQQSAAIIGWFVVDEPQAWTLRDHELTDIYNAVKAVDPYRLAIINWNSDDVPASVGKEPHGSLAASDFYSIDYYPFMNDGTNLETFTLRTTRQLRTAALAGRPGHAWLQLYGYLDAVREPTGDELNYMSYLNLLYGGNYSYWQTKSNARSTWEHIGTTNREIDSLERLLMLNPAATETEAPRLDGHYLYSLWTLGDVSYLIVIHVGRKDESFRLNLADLLGRRPSAIRRHFDEADVDMAGSVLADRFGAYATRVYEIR